MSITPLGRLPAALINSGSVTQLKPDPQVQETPSGSAKFSSEPESIERLEKEAMQALREGRFTDITDKLVQQGKSESYDRYEGKTVVEKKGLDFIIGSMYTEDGQPILNAGYGEVRAKLGAPDHAFFYHNTDFLMDKASEYAKLVENEMLPKRNINSLNFAKDTLDFFTDGNFTSKDVTAMQEQINDVVRELSEQMKNGETVDLSKVQNKLTIGGDDVTISQVLDFQKVGGALKESFDQISVGQLNTQAYAQMGMSKAMANYYGSDKGEIGAMFSSAMDKLYEKGISQTDSLITHVTSRYSGYQQPLTAREQNAIKTSTEIRDTFAKLDISSKENLAKDFSSKLSMVRDMVQSHCSQFGVSTSHVSLAGDTAGIANYFNAWINNV